MTAADCIILAAAALERDGETPFTAEALVVRAWRSAPRTLGLQGFEADFPSDHRVLSHLMGRKGLVSRGLLRRTASRMYALTDAGRQHAAALAAALVEAPAADRNGTAAPEPVVHRLDLIEGLFLQRRLESATLHHWRQDGVSRGQINFDDALRWLDVGRQDHNVPAVLADHEGRLAAAESLAATGEIVLVNGRAVDAAAVAELRAVDTYLRQRFARHLSVLGVAKKEAKT